MNGQERVYLAGLEPASPVYHLVPDWHTGDGRRGEEVDCNVIVHASTGEQIGSGGIPLPEEIVAPCGVTVYRRAPIVDSDPWEAVGIATLNKTRMVPQGALIPYRHAEKFGRPCRRCFP